MIQGAIWVIIAVAIVSVVSNVSAVMLKGLAGQSF
jgi:Flp pilus assembly pilin Flp